ncbi:MAG: hypothetical protein IT560_13355 [Alphaproteobacteria bacterium]|nr:hypothetical protein [Alphaproteobacteria bacterium]
MTSIAASLENWFQSRAPDEIRALSKYLLALVADPQRVMNVVVRLTAFCVFVSLLLTHDLWFMEGRLYAPAPVVAGLPPSVNIFLYGLMLAVCGLLCVLPEQRRWGALVAPAFIYFVLQDQLRGQFYLYMYVFALVACAAAPKRVEDKHLDAVRLMLAGVYIWAGVYKLNAIFITQVFPWFVAPFFPFPEAAKVIGFAVPFLESAVGLLLFFPRWRWLSQILAFCMLTVVLQSIGPLGHNQALPVWPANVYMDALVIFLFIGNRRALVYKPPLHIAAAALFIALPALGCVKQMGPHPTFQLYCGCVPLAQVEFARGEDFGFLPETLATLAAADGSLEASDITYRLFNVSGCNFSPSHVPYQEGLRGFCPHLKKPQQTKLRVREPESLTSTAMTETVYDLCTPEGMAK